MAIFSLGLIPFFRAPLRELSREAWSWLGGGAFLMAIQGLPLIVTLAIFGDATAVNVVYGSRGLWSVLAVWWLGARLGTRESNLGMRLSGAALMFAALILVVV